MFVDSSARARMVAAAAVVSALGSLNLLVIADRLADKTAPAAGGWTYFQYSLDFAAVMMLVFVAAFVGWFYRAYGNLPALTGIRSRWHVAWTLAGWLLPLANLFLPLLLLWETGSKSAGAGDGRGKWLRGLVLWWAFLLPDAGLLDVYWRQIAAVGLHAPPAVFAAAIGPEVPEIVFAQLLFAVDGLLGAWLAVSIAAMQRQRFDEPPALARPEPVKQQGYY